jgi:glycosyltransferase involved in cell wall biosynthesis
MKMHKLSIVTPSYNAGRYLPLMIQSIKSQNVDCEIEHIIFDNCSTDDTGSILNAYMQSSGGVDVKCYVEPDRGQTDAINKGFRLASGDLVCWLNADESFEPFAVRRVLDFSRRMPDVDVFFGDIYFSDASGRKTEHRKSFGFSASMLLYYGCYIPSCATFIRKRVLDQGEFLDETFRVTMDFEYYVRLLKKNYSFFNIPYPLATFSLRKDNISVVERGRRRSERYMVQSAYSSLPGGRGVKVVIFGLLEWYWVGVRVIRRVYFSARGLASRFGERLR